MLPYLAQGANSAMEDGAVLGLLLGAMQSRDQLPKALRMYQRLRKVRVDAIVRETFKQVRKQKCNAAPAIFGACEADAALVQRDCIHMPDGPEQEARDEIFLSQLGQDVKAPFPNRWICPDAQRWVCGYDAYQDVAEAISRDPFRLDSARDMPAAYEVAMQGMNNALAA
jgi:salicylate hydroxylase